MTLKNWVARLPQQARWLVLSSGSLLLLCVLLVLLQISVTLFSGLSQITNTKPRIAKLLGYEEASQEIRAAAEASNAALSIFAFDDSVDADQRGAELQKALRRFASEAGLSIIGSQFVREVDSVEPPSDAFITLGVDLTMNGPPLGLDVFLTEVYNFEPALKVVSLDLQQPRRQQRGSVPGVNEDGVNIRTQIVALMVASE